jgi:hypothetical protein
MRRIFSTVRAPQLPALTVGSLADGPQPRHHAVRGQVLGEHVGEQAVFDEGTGVEQEVQPLADRQLVLLAKLGQIARPALERSVAELAMPGVRHL